MTFRAGVVGCGRIGSEFEDSHAGVYATAAEVELIAVSDINREKREQCGSKWGVTALYEDYREMLKKESLDILSICTWNSTHLEIVTEAVNRGVKAIYCEKPVADTLRNADGMIELCHQKAILQINHQRRFDGLFRQVREFLQKGKLGEIQQATFFYTRGIANTGSHMFDLLGFLLGDVDWVEACYSQHKSHDVKDPNIDGTVKFRNGIPCQIIAGEDQSVTMFDMNLVGTKGSLKLIRNGAEVEYYQRQGDGLQRHDSPFNMNIPRKSMVKAVEHLLMCLKEKKESVSSGVSGRAALELICAFHESAGADGRKIHLPLSGSNVKIESL